MDNTYFKNFGDIIVKEIAPGYHAKLIHTDHNTINFLVVDAGAEISLHTHPHQQLAFVLEGEFELTINGDTQTLTPDRFAVIPSNVPHKGKAVTNCKLIDVFNPVREDLKNL